MDAAPNQNPTPVSLPPIVVVRGVRVLFDHQLAALYGVTTGALNQAVRRNQDRFPGDFAFVLGAEDFANLISQTVISSLAEHHGGRRKPVMAFTEQGVAMLSSVLRSPRAIAVNIEIMRAFVRLREFTASYADLLSRIETLQATYDEQFTVVFDAIRALVDPPEEGEPKPPIGFRS
jgi:hypothetical protein